MKSVRERMDMHAAYREVGSYRAAAQICGTTAKTVKRAVLVPHQATFARFTSSQSALSLALRFRQEM